MTPLEIEILIHYYGHADDFRSGDFSAPAVRDAIDWFKDGGKLLELDASGNGRSYKLSERGVVFVEALCNTKLPEQRWVMP